MSASGHVVWPSPADPIWRFDWILADSPDQEGIVIRNASYRGRQVFYKASLPSLRVQYDGVCGPYKDPLSYTNAVPTTRCPQSRVCQYSYVAGGLRAICVESFHKIGSYRLTDRWVFWENGHVYPRLYSAGLQCNDNHRHHAYWRFDFDIGGASNDLVLEYNTYAGNVGWGNGWEPQRVETSRVKAAASGRTWAVLDKGSQRGYFIYPGANDGMPDTFSNRDLWILRYRGSEDKHGNQGDRFDDGLHAYLNGEGVDAEDVVVWYCGHLAHEAHGGGDEWHHVGPNLVPFNTW